MRGGGRRGGCSTGDPVAPGRCGAARNTGCVCRFPRMAGRQALRDWASIPAQEHPDERAGLILRLHATAPSTTTRALSAPTAASSAAEDREGSRRRGAPVGANAVAVAPTAPARTGVAVSVGAARVATPPRATVIVLPGASSTEGIAVGRGSTFYAGYLLRGDIFRGDLQRGTADGFIASPAGRMATGMKVDVPSGLLFVAGGPTGQAYVYDTATGATVAIYQLGDSAAGTSINDVAPPPGAPGSRTAGSPSCTWC